MSNFIPIINEKAGVPKFLQLANAFADAVKTKELNVGDALPSVNELCAKCGLSRDTVFKAYSELKNRNLIESVPSKGYYVSSNTHKVFLFLDTLKAYKEVLYGAFRASLPNNISVDVHFHHYNAQVFNDIIRAAAGKYSHYIIMNFDHKKVRDALRVIDPSKLLCIDWKVNVPKNCSFIGQDFKKPVYDNMVKVIDKLHCYNKVIFVFPEYTNHPKDTVIAFEQFCRDFKLNYQIIYQVTEMNPQKGEVYFTVNDRVLAKLLDITHEKGYELGVDLGIVSYNETPTKKYIKEGITVVSTNFTEIGIKMAKFIVEGEKFDEFVPTDILIRHSL
jgi:DNA-binding transcriptional regulator YhcF (GntR family)